MAVAVVGMEFAAADRVVIAKFGKTCYAEVALEMKGG